MKKNIKKKVSILDENFQDLINSYKSIIEKIYALAGHPLTDEEALQVKTWLEEVDPICKEIAQVVAFVKGRHKNCLEWENNFNEFIQDMKK
jgi:hypothetical protein